MPNLNVLLLVLSLLYVATAKPTTYCNPVNLNYRFSFVEPSHREAADPTMVVHNGTYWLFASKSGGYWHSTDMNDWTFVEPTGLPIEDYAPMVVVLGGKFFYTAFNSRAIFTTDDPFGGQWTKAAGTPEYSDPGMLVDDDGKVYMYWGCSSNGNIRAVQLDNATWQQVGDVVDAVTPDHEHRGFEVGGDNNEILDHLPYVEGSFMNKINGKYYLQYAVPGTQYKSYADGLYVGDSPLGPFEFQPYSPMSSFPSGFAAGAGHSSSYQDPQSEQYWHIGTSTISVRHNFERRLGIYPLITPNPWGDRLWVDSYLGDYPHALPGTKESRVLGATPKWMLLSLNKAATASSGKNPGLAFNEDIRTWWSADTGNGGEWLQVDLNGSYTVNSVQVNFADQDSDIVGTRPAEDDVYRYFVEFCTSTGGADCVWQRVADLDRSNNTRDRPHDYVELEEPLTGVTRVRITNLNMPGGTTKFSISGFRVFGLGPDGGSSPAPVANDDVKILRDTTDGRHVTLSWPAAEGAEFYVVRFGASCTGYCTTRNYRVYDGATTVDIRSLVVGQDYDYVIDSVNSNGVTLGTPSAFFA